MVSCLPSGPHTIQAGAWPPRSHDPVRVRADDVILPRTICQKIGAVTSFRIGGRSHRRNPNPNRLNSASAVTTARASMVRAWMEWPNRWACIWIAPFSKVIGRRRRRGGQGGGWGLWSLHGLAPCQVGGGECFPSSDNRSCCSFDVIDKRDVCL